MSLKLPQLKPRDSSYGQQRKFRGLEKFAIQRRLRASYGLIEQLLSENQGSELTVLELGCGFFGNNLRTLHQQFQQVGFIGIDIAVDEQSMENIELLSADLRSWRPNGTYDAVLSLAVIEHLIEPHHHFELISDCLRKGGLAGITTPAPQAHELLSFFAKLGIFDKGEIGDHQIYLTETGLRNLARETNLEVLEYKKFSFGFNQWILASRN